MKLLTRDEFRETVFKRDKYKCVVCGEDGVYFKMSPLKFQTTVKVSE